MKLLSSPLTYLVLVGAIVLIFVGFPPLGQLLANQSWTGFGPYVVKETNVTTTTKADGSIESQTSTVEKPQREKTLWDWVQIFIVPLVLAVVGTLINSTIQRNQAERTEALAQAEKGRADKMAEVERARTTELAKIEREKIDKQFELTREQMQKQLDLSKEQAENEARDNHLQTYFVFVTTLIKEEGFTGKMIDIKLSSLQAYTIGVSALLDDPNSRMIMRRFLDTLQRATPYLRGNSSLEEFIEGGF